MGGAVEVLYGGRIRELVRPHWVALCWQGGGGGRAGRGGVTVAAKRCLDGLGDLELEGEVEVGGRDGGGSGQEEAPAAGGS